MIIFVTTNILKNYYCLHWIIYLFLKFDL